MHMQTPSIEKLLNILTVCKHASMQERSMQVSKYAKMQVCEYAVVQVCKYASVLVCKVDLQKRRRKNALLILFWGKL
jgi:hypothetical protein